jgi:hypothetical protein
MFEVWHVTPADRCVIDADILRHVEGARGRITSVFLGDQSVRPTAQAAAIRAD